METDRTFPHSRPPALPPRSHQLSLCLSLLYINYFNAEVNIRDMSQALLVALLQVVYYIIVYTRIVYYTMVYYNILYDITHCTYRIYIVFISEIIFNLKMIKSRFKQKRTYSKETGKSPSPTLLCFNVEIRVRNILQARMPIGTVVDTLRRASLNHYYYY